MPMSDRANLFGKFRAAKSNQWSYVGDGWVGRKTIANNYSGHTLFACSDFLCTYYCHFCKFFAMYCPHMICKVANRLQSSPCNGRYRKQNRREVFL